jgi:hypothetical protein
MTLSPAELEILTCANEDWHGLWEGLASIRSAFPDLTEDEVLETGQSTVRSLLDKELIYLCWFRHETNEETRLSIEESKLLIEDAAKWDPPDWGDRYVALAATAAGQRAWMKPRPALTTLRKRHETKSPG